jgi:hypothetical protein
VLEIRILLGLAQACPALGFVFAAVIFVRIFFCEFLALLLVFLYALGLAFLFGGGFGFGFGLCGGGGGGFFALYFGVFGSVPGV